MINYASQLEVPHSFPLEEEIHMEFLAPRTRAQMEELSLFLDGRHTHFEGPKPLKPMTFPRSQAHFKLQKVGAETELSNYLVIQITFIIVKRKLRTKEVK